MSIDRAVSTLSLILTVAAGFVAMSAMQRVETMQDDMEAREARMAAAPAEVPPPPPPPVVADELGEAMNSFARRFAGLWFAGRSGHWRLADYEIREMQEVIKEIQAMNKFETGVNVGGVLDAVNRTQLKEIDNAVVARDPKAFEIAYHNMLKACNSCHTSSGHSYIQVKVPDQEPVVNRIYTPAPKEPAAVKVSDSD